MKQSVSPGIEALVAEDFRSLSGARIALLANQAAVDSRGIHLLDHLNARPDVTVVRMLAAEHGTDGKLPPGATVPDSHAGDRRIPVMSLYPPESSSGALVAPQQALSGADLLIIDMPDVGSRYFTYFATALSLIRRAALQQLPVLVLDRPNPLGGLKLEGPIPEYSLRSAVSAAPVPIRHGLTLGELLQWMNIGLASPASKGWPFEPIGAPLSVQPVRGWNRAHSFEATGLPWVRPSPNLPSPSSLLLYAGTCLFEGAPCSVGRGTERPFALLGHPDISPGEWLRRFDSGYFSLDGAALRTARFTPRLNPYAGRLCHGLEIELTDPGRFQPVRWAISLLLSLKASHPALFDEALVENCTGAAHLSRLFGSPVLSDILHAPHPRGADDFFALSSELRMGEEWFGTLRATRAPLGADGTTALLSIERADKHTP